MHLLAALGVSFVLATAPHMARETVNEAEAPETVDLVDRIKQALQDEMIDLYGQCGEMATPMIFHMQQEPEWLGPISVRGRWHQYCFTAADMIYMIVIEDVLETVVDSEEGFTVRVPLLDQATARKMLRREAVDLYKRDVIVMWEQIDKDRLAFDRRFPQKPRPPYASVHRGPRYLGEQD